MARFPNTGNIGEIGHDLEKLAGPVSLLSYIVQNKGPGRNECCGNYLVLPWEPEDPANTTTIANDKAVT